MDVIRNDITRITDVASDFAAAGLPQWPQYRDDVIERDVIGGKMRDQVIQLVEAYIDAVRKNDPDALPLHPDVEFNSPLNAFSGIAAFRKSLAEFFPILRSIEIVRLVADDSACAASLNLDTVYGVLPFLELFHILGNQIMSIRAYYDPRPILEGIKRDSA